MNRSRGRYTIRSEMLERWAKDHNLEFAGGGPDRSAGPVADQSFDGIFAAMQRGGLFFDVPAEDRETALRAAVDVIPGISSADRPKVLEVLLEREQLASTGIGNGIALPHPRSNPGIQLAMPQITTCFLSRGGDFAAVDNRPVAVLMVLLSNSTKQHLAMLSKLSYYLRDASFRECLLKNATEASVFDKIKSIESKE